MTRRRPRLPVVLYAVALLLACGCVVGGVFAWRTHQDRVDARAEQDRYGEVVRAAEEVATAFVNIDYEDPEATFEAVSASATGNFLEQYEQSSESLVELVTLYEAVLEGKVITTAVSSVDDDSATVLVATEGSVTNAQTGGEGQARNFRLLLDLVRTDGEWRADNLEFVG